MSLNFKKIYLFISSLIFLFVVYVSFYLNTTVAGFQMFYEFYILDNCILLGLDSISLVFLFLTSMVIPLCFLFNWGTLKSSTENFFFFSILLLIEVLLILVFLVLELVFFYIVFEFLLIPFYFLIALTNGKQYSRNVTQVNKKINAFFLLFFYTIIGSLLMLFGILLIYINFGSTLMPVLWYSKMGDVVEHFLWLLFFISFSVKIPIVPLHLWLPEAHVESPTEGSVILAAVLLKIGLYGVIRILLPCFSEACITYCVWVWLLGIISVIYTSMTACVQVDIKRIIAYASIGHMNICVLGLFSLDIPSIFGSIILMFAHGLASAGLFFVIGMLYNRFHTKNIKYYNGIVFSMPILSICFFLFSVSNFGMPGTLNFIGEFYIFSSFFENDIFYIYVGIFGSILLSSFYTIYLYNHISFGNSNKYFSYNTSDITSTELIVLIILILFIFILGIFPSPMTDFLKLDLNYYFYYYK